MSDDTNIIAVISNDLTIETIIVEEVQIVAEIIGEGPPGYTPQKGIDYFTQEDIDELVSEIRQTYIHEQILASNVWNITHNLGKFPSVTVVDSAGSLIVGEVDYISNSSLTLRFTSSFSGKVYLN